MWSAIYHHHVLFIVILYIFHSTIIDFSLLKTLHKNFDSATNYADAMPKHLATFSSHK